MCSDPFDLLRRALERLRLPAPGPRFASPADIDAAPKQFGARCNRSFRAVHMTAVRQILAIEAVLRESDKKDPKRLHLEAWRNIWRRVNDSLVWTMLGFQRHLIKRLWLDHTRAFLADQNPESILDALDSIHKDPRKLGVWTDTTTVVDVGDIISRDVLTGVVSLLEVKSGKATDCMFAGLTCDRAMEYFLKDYGVKGRKQVERFLRQAKRGLDIADAMNQDKFVDFHTGRHLDLTELSTRDRFYDIELDKMMTSTQPGQMSVFSVDDCLWLVVGRAPSVQPDQLLDTLTTAVMESATATATREWLEQFGASASVGPVSDIRMGLQHPVTQPLFTRLISTGNVIDILRGEAVVLMYFDWPSFARLVESNGGSFSWSSRKAGRRALAKGRDTCPLLVGERIPTVAREECSFQLGAPLFLRVLCDGLRPESLAQQSVESLAQPRPEPSSDDEESTGDP